MRNHVRVDLAERAIRWDGKAMKLLQFTVASIVAGRRWNG